MKSRWCAFSNQIISGDIFKTQIGISLPVPDMSLHVICQNIVCGGFKHLWWSSKQNINEGKQICLGGLQTVNPFTWPECHSWVWFMSRGCQFFKKMIFLYSTGKKVVMVRTLIDLGPFHDDLARYIWHFIFTR